MPLVDLDLPITSSTWADDVGTFLREANRRVDRFLLTGRSSGFVPSDYERAYCILRGVVAENLASGNLFCEWGSGHGVVACLAALLDFDANGIEVELELVQSAAQLAEDFDLPVEFICGSFIPNGAKVSEHVGDDFAWFTTDASDAHPELGLGPDDFDVIFAYPWPDEEKVTEGLFERFARVGALLLTYHGGDVFRLRRKLRPKTSRGEPKGRTGNRSRARRK